MRLKARSGVCANHTMDTQFTERPDSDAHRVASRYEMIAHISDGGFFDWSRKDGWVASDKLRLLLSLPPDEPADLVTLALRRLSTASLKQLQQARRALCASQPQLSIDLETRGGRVLELRAMGVFAGDKCVRLVGSLCDVTRDRLAASTLRRHAYTDDLTGLSNRRAAHSHLQSSLKRAHIEPIALVYLDVENYGTVNENYGITVAEEFLKRFAQRMRQHSSECTCIARVSITEFLILCRDHKQSEAKHKFESLRREIERNIDIQGSVSITPCVIAGLNWVNNRREDSKTALRNAEIAMHCAKQGHSREVMLYEPFMLEAKLEYQRTADALRGGMARNEFELYYHPIINTQDRSNVGLEALLRWNSPLLGFTPADKFVPILEEHGLITELTESLLDRLLADLIDWDRIGVMPDYVSFNLSPLQLASPSLLKHCEAFFNRISVFDVQIVFEITESAVIEDLPYAQKVLKVLRDMGAVIALDDFGRGYSSLAVLHQLPIDILKLDGQFTESLFDSERSEQVIRSILQLSETLNLPAVAERVETASEAEWFIEAGCQYLQGFLFSSPMSPLDTVQYVIETRNTPQYSQAL